MALGFEFGQVPFPAFGFWALWNQEFPVPGLVFQKNNKKIQFWFCSDSKNQTLFQDSSG
jgi:hypothetical protein